MTNLKNNIQKAFKQALLNEARILPNDADIAACPSIYKGVPTQNLPSYIENGFGRIPTIWLDPTYVDKYNLDKVIIESGFHSAASVYKN